MVYLFLADGFEEIEALTQADYLRRAGIEVLLVGVSGKTVVGGHGISVNADKDVENVNLDDAEMVILPGGLGGVDGIKSSAKAISLIKEAYEKKIYIAAICAAPTILAQLGMLKGVKAVCYPSMLDILSENGAVIMPESAVVRENNIITAKAAGASEQFSFELIKALKGADAAEKVRDSICAR